jgi:hypothetical protein
MWCGHEIAVVFICRYLLAAGHQGEIDVFQRVATHLELFDVRAGVGEPSAQKFDRVIGRVITVERRRTS